MDSGPQIKNNPFDGWHQDPGELPSTEKNPVLASGAHEPLRPEDIRRENMRRTPPGGIVRKLSAADLTEIDYPSEKAKARAESNQKPSGNPQQYITSEVTDRINALARALHALTLFASVSSDKADTVAKGMRIQSELAATSQIGIPGERSYE